MLNRRLTSPSAISAEGDDQQSQRVRRLKDRKRCQRHTAPTTVALAARGKAIKQAPEGSTVRAVLLSWLLAITFATLAGCARPYSTAVVTDRSARIPGVWEALRTKEQATVDLLLIHGMCTHDRGWVSDINTRLVRALSGNEGLSDSSKLIAKFEEETELHAASYGVAGSTLRTFSILWSPAAARQKAALCFDQTTKGPYCKEEAAAYPYARASINAKLKDRLLNDCLADALVYSGLSRERIQRQVMQAILHAMGSRSSVKAPEALTRAAEAEQSPMFVLSESLGSKILFDSLLRLYKAPATQRAAAQSFARTAQVFMAANQIPILTLAYDETSGVQGLQTDAAAPVADPLDALTKELGLRRRKLQGSLGIAQPAAETLQVAAFSDPNDLLSYPLTDSAIAGRKSYKLVDVIVSNDRTWLGALENPYAAHLDYRENKEVLRLIVCGFPTAKNCPM
jgi:hypothetical protein